MEFEVNDLVEAYKSFIGYITYVDRKNNTADVEWDEGNFDYNCTVVPLKYLEKVIKYE